MHDLFSMKDSFERGSKDIFVLTVNDVGTITCIEVSVKKCTFPYIILVYLQFSETLFNCC